MKYTKTWHVYQSMYQPEQLLLWMESLQGPNKEKFPEL